MKSKTKIECPKCNHEFSIGNDIISKTVLNNLKQKSEDEIENKLKDQYNLKLKNHERDLNDKFYSKFKDLEDQVKNRDEKITKSNEQHLKALKLERSLMEKMESFDLEIEKRVNEKNYELKKTYDEKYRMKIDQNEKKEKDNQKRIQEMQFIIDEYKQGNVSQQYQGAASQDKIKKILEETYTEDEFVGIKTGESGADLIQKVFNERKECGKILIENKEVKKWSNNWVEKLKSDAEELGIEFPVLITSKLKNKNSFFEVNGNVFIMHPNIATQLIGVLRFIVIELDRSKNVFENSNSKKDLLYKYINGNQFLNSIQNLLTQLEEQFSIIEKEERSHRINWNKRKKSLESAFLSSSNIQSEIGAIIHKRFEIIENMYDEDFLIKSEEVKKLEV